MASSLANSSSSSSSSSTSSSSAMKRRYPTQQAQHASVSSSSSSSSSSSLYPLHPSDSQVLVRFSAEEYSWFDQLLVHGSSLIIVGSIIWVPAALYVTYRQWRRAKHGTKRRLILGAIFWSLLGLVTVGPHRHPRIGQWLQIRKWSLWKAWLRFVAFEVIAERTKRQDNSINNNNPSKIQEQPSSIPATTRSTTSITSSSSTSISTNPPIFAFCPHGIFPFAFGMAAFFEQAAQAMGTSFRPIIASAVRYLPVVNTLVSYARAVDASRGSVHRVMATEEAVGLVPGGIAEIFEGYPKVGEHPDEEYTIVRKGFLKMALQHNRPVVPIYCFGATKMLRRLNIPLLEWLSNLWRISLCVFYGVGGLPLPFRQRLTYIMGEPIHPPSGGLNTSSSSAASAGPELDALIDQMHEQFCQSLQSMFDRHKEAYGWGHKTLKILSR